MRIGIRLAISGLVLASIMVSAIGVHILWWRTAEANSHALADTINGQIVSTVEKELATITTEARAAHTAIRTLFVQNVLETREADKREVTRVPIDAADFTLLAHPRELDVLRTLSELPEVVALACTERAHGNVHRSSHRPLHHHRRGIRDQVIPDGDLSKDRLPLAARFECGGP